jgi:hypothetical protein
VPDVATTRRERSAANAAPDPACAPAAPSITRRGFLAGVSLLPLAAALSPRFLAQARAASPGYVFFTEHQAAVVREATARLIPGPTDDPAEAGHPGAREADVVRFVDRLLGAFGSDPPQVHSGGPWSDRPDPSQPDYMASFVPLTRVQTLAWQRRIGALQQTYRDGVDVLDARAGGDFSTAPAPDQDAILASSDAAGFRDVLFTHAVEGMYSVPEYGGNAGLAGWRDIGFRGDTQPVGYTPAEVSRSDGPDPLILDGVVAQLAGRFDAVGAALAGRWRRGG